MNQRGGLGGGPCGRSGKTRDSLVEGRAHEAWLLRDPGPAGGWHRRGRHGGAAGRRGERGVGGGVDPLRQQGCLELLRFRQRRAKPAVLHHQEGRNRGRRRADGPRLERDLWRRRGRLELRHVERAHRVPGGLRRQRHGERGNERLQGLGQELRHDQGLHRHPDDGHRALFEDGVQHHAGQQRRLRCRSAHERQHGSRHQTRRHHQLPPNRQHHARQQRPRDPARGQRDRKRRREQRLLQQRPHGQPRRRGHLPDLGAGQHGPQQPRPRQRGLGHRAVERLQQQHRVRQRRVQERRPRHRHPQLDRRKDRLEHRLQERRLRHRAADERRGRHQQQHQRRQRHQQPPHQGQHQSGRLGVGLPDDDGLQRPLPERRQRPDRLSRRQVHDARVLPGSDRQGAPRQAGRPQVRQLRVGRLPSPRRIAGDRFGQLGRGGSARRRLRRPGAGRRSAHDEHRGRPARLRRPWRLRVPTQWRSSAGGRQRHRHHAEERRSDRQRAGQRQRPRQRSAHGHRHIRARARHRRGERQQHRHLHPGGQLLRARLLQLHDQRR